MTKKTSFDEAAYKRRLRVLRLIVAEGNNINEFARRVEIDPKRWNNYERGKPLSRETAFWLWTKLKLSAEWLWWGETGNLTPEWKERIKIIEAVELKHREIEREFERVKQRSKQRDEERQRALQSLSSSSRRRTSSSSSSLK